MSQPDLFTPAYPVGAGSKVEGTLTDKLAQYFRLLPNQWVDGLDLARVAGSYAWRSRCSDLRKPPYGMTIENKVERVQGMDGIYRRSLYRYVREAD
jgi:hypothetical protein